MHIVCKYEYIESTNQYQVILRFEKKIDVNKYITEGFFSRKISFKDADNKDRKTADQIWRKDDGVNHR